MIEQLKTALCSRHEAAVHLRVSSNTLAVWACNGRYGLPYVKIGSRVMYRLADIEQFIANNLIGGEVLQ